MLNYQRVEPTRVFGRSCARLVRAPGTWLPRAAVAQRVSRQRWCKANGMVAGTSAVSPLWTGSFLLGKKHVPIMVKIMVVSLPWRSREFRMRQTQSWMAFAIDWWTSEGPQTDAPNANPSNTTNSAHFFPGVQMRSIRRRPKGGRTTTGKAFNSSDCWACQAATSQPPWYHPQPYHWTSHFLSASFRQVFRSIFGSKISEKSPKNQRGGFQGIPMAMAAPVWPFSWRATASRGRTAWPGSQSSPWKDPTVFQKNHVTWNCLDLKIKTFKNPKNQKAAQSHGLTASHRKEGMPGVRGIHVRQSERPHWSALCITSHKTARQRTDVSSVVWEN